MPTRRLSSARLVSCLLRQPPRLKLPKSAPATSATLMRAEQFFASWKFELDSDFVKDDQQAAFFPGHPKQWGDETASINLSKAERHRSTIIALNEDGTLLAASVLGGVLIYDVASLTLVRALKMRPRSMDAIAFQPGHGKEGKILVGATYMKGQHSMTSVLKCWDLRNADSTYDALQEATNASASLALTMMTEKGTWSIDDVDESRIQDGVFDTISMAQLEMELQMGHAFEGTIQQKAFNSDGSYFLYIKDQKIVVIMDSESLQERYSLVGHTDAIMWAETSPDDSIIGTSSWDRTVRLWDATTGQEIRVLTGATNQSWSGAFSPDGKLISAGCGDQQFRIWSVESGELLHTLGGYKGWVRSLAFSPDGKTIAAGAGGGTLKVFDVETGESKQHWQVKLSGHGYVFIEVGNVLYTSRGLLVLKVGDGVVLTYDEKTNQKGQYGHGPGVSGASSGGEALVTPDGETLIIADFDGCIRSWRLE